MQKAKRYTANDILSITMTCVNREDRLAHRGDSNKPRRQSSLNTFNVREMAGIHMAKSKVTVQTHNVETDQNLGGLLIGHSI